MSHDVLKVTAETPRLREALTEAGYTDRALIEIFGPVSMPSRTGRGLPYFLQLTRAAGRVDTLARLFLIGVPVPEGQAREALAPIPLETWAAAGVIAAGNGEVRPLARLLPFRGLLLACDQLDLQPEGQPDLVMGITNSTVELADFVVQQQWASALDLGCGSGALAFLAAPHSHRVCAADSSARAVNFARFNAVLNGISNVEFREGDAFKPVEGETFDLVMSNPPFAVTPSQRYIYRDGGMPLDGFCRNLLRQAPRFLNEGGYCQITCDWVHLKGQDWKERLAGWFEGSGCDAWALRVDTHDPVSYAHVWIRDTEHLDPAAESRLYEQWLSYYEREGVEAISTGLIALRRRTAPSNWVRIDDAPATTSGQFGEYVALGFELREYLEQADDGQLLGARLRVSPSARLDQACEWSEGAWRIASARLRLAQGLQYATDIDLRLAGLVARCDGRHTIGELLAQMAKALGADLEQITPNCLALLRQLIERGFLLPV